MQVRGSHVGSYLPNCGVWHHTQRYLKKRTLDMNVVHHLDFDAPTRENANLLPDDKVWDNCCLQFFCTFNLVVSMIYINGYANLFVLYVISF